MGREEHYEMHPDRIKKVLIIDDDRMDREILKTALNQSSSGEFEFAEATCSEEGIELCREWLPDCVLLDFHLPDRDGIETLGCLMAESGRPICAVVMLTAFGGEVLAVRAMKAGATDYLAKEQVAAQKLPQTVRNAIERFRLSEQVELQRAALEESWRRYQSLLEAIPHMVWVANADGHIEYANAQWFKYTGLDVGVAALGWHQLIHEDDRESTWRAWAAAAASGRDFEFAHRVRRAADGAFRWHLARAVRMQAVDGPDATWFGTYTDIDDQKQAEKTAREREKLETIGRLAGGIAHDFNNLLVGVLGGAGCAMDTLPLHHPAQRMLETVVESGQRAAELTRKMLAYAGKGNVFRESINLNRVVEEVYEKMRPSIPKNIHFEFRLARALPDVRTDIGQLGQVVTDLLRNAVEAVDSHAPGAVSVTTASMKVEQPSRKPEFADAEIAPGMYVALEVQDTGCGMDGETRKKAFDPFFSTKSMGRGLGLAAVLGFVRSNGGDVQIVSALGNGTTLHVLLPAISKNESVGPPLDTTQAGVEGLCQGEGCH
jgi:PAS domain S-box-containing protein